MTTYTIQTTDGYEVIAGLTLEAARSFAAAKASAMGEELVLIPVGLEVARTEMRRRMRQFAQTRPGSTARDVARIRLEAACRAVRDAKGAK